MNREFLKQLGLTDEQIESTMKEHGKSVQSVKSELESVTTERDNLNQQLVDRDTQLGDLKKEVEDNTELTSRISELEQANEATKAEYKGILEAQQRDFAIESALRDAKAINPIKAKRALTEELESVVFEDGKLIGLEEIMNTVKETDAYLFKAKESKKEEKEEPKEPQFKGAVPGQPKTKEPGGKPDVSKMTYKEFEQYLATQNK